MDHPGAMDALLTQLHDVLATAGRMGTEAATGTSSDGLVTATADPSGRVAALEADPRVLRRTAGELASAITEAVNEALDAVAATAGGSDLGAELRAIQEDSARVMRQTASEYTAAVERMKDLHP